MKRKSKFILIVFVLFFLLSQTFLRAAEETKNNNNFFKNIFDDEIAIWTSPAHMKAEHLLLWVPVVATTLILIANDENIYFEFQKFKDNNDWVQDLSPQITKLGDGWSSVIISGAFYLGGLAFKSDRAKKTAVLGLQVLVHTGIVVQVGKHLTGRSRPGYTDGVDHWYGPSGFFKRYEEGFAKYDAFPSGHTITVWGMATVIAEQYKDKAFIPIISYTLATLTGLSRVTEKAHWLSDVFLGAVLGHTIAEFIIKRDRLRNLSINPYVSSDGIKLSISYSF